MSQVLLFTASGIIFLWGVAHIMPVRGVVRGFGEISQDNKRIITMEWLAEGLALCFIGVLVGVLAFSGGAQNSTASLVLKLCAVMLFVMASLTALTGARTSVIPMKFCPIVKSACGVMILVGSI